MYKNSSPQTKSFIILFGIAVVGVYLSFMLSNNLINGGSLATNGNYNVFYYSQSTQKPANAVTLPEPGLPPFKNVDVANWKTYTGGQYHFSFKYDPAWTILPGKTDKNGYYILQINPGKKLYNIKIFISQSSFFAMEGLPTVTQSIAGQPAINVANLLYGIKNGPYYYTFDNGLSTNMIDGFNAMVRTVSFQ